MWRHNGCTPTLVGSGRPQPAELPFSVKRLLQRPRTYVYCRMLGCEPIRNLNQVDVKTCTKYGFCPVSHARHCRVPRKVPNDASSRILLAARSCSAQFYAHLFDSVVWFGVSAGGAARVWCSFSILRGGVRSRCSLARQFAWVIC